MKRLLLVAVLLLAFLTGCTRMEDVHPPQFHHGQMVKMRINGQEGQILQRIYFSWNYEAWVYKVRFVSLDLRIPEHLLGSGGPVKMSPYVELTVCEFEMEKGQ